MMIYRSVILDFIIQRPENLGDGFLFGEGWNKNGQRTNRRQVQSLGDCSITIAVNMSCHDWRI